MMKTIFTISHMDCPTEEQMVRMKLEAMAGIEALEFDLPQRTLIVYHNSDHELILNALISLNLGTTLVKSVEENVVSGHQEAHTQQKRILTQVLSVNLFFFVLEMIAGLIAGSMGLVADSLDMLADSIVYGLALTAVGGTEKRKKGIAGVAGYFQAILAVLGFFEVIRRFLFQTETPEFGTMVIVSFFALFGNALCLYLLQKSKSREAHMEASMIFTSTDVIVNVGVMAAGGLVYLTSSKIPDLLVGTIVFVLVLRGARRIISLSR
jgi:Co/Zn/Cd efflux system component